MKKKIFLSLVLMLMCTILFGCEGSVLANVKKNMSECAKVYYFGENENFYCNISSGLREKEYFMDGQVTGCVDYALVSLHFFNQERSGAISVEVSIDDKTKTYEMEFNSLNGNFMVDLEKELSGSERVAVKFANESLDLQCVSNDFGVDYDKVLEIASKEMKGKIELKKEYSKLNCEMYLRVLDKKANGSEEIFWCFTVLNCDNENYSIVISTKDGSILAKSN